MTDLRIVSPEGRGASESARRKLRKSERREHILLELKLRPHVRVGELAIRFGVSGETIRRDIDALAGEGLIARAHGGASALGHGRHPGFDERATARIEERERIGRLAASLVQPGETLMIDSGSTTLQCARFLAAAGTPCTVVTNSLPVAMSFGQDTAQVILCPGDYLAEEAAVVGPETVDFLMRYRVNRCLIGAAGVSVEGASEVVQGFAAIKRAMLSRSAHSHLLVASDKLGQRKFVRVAGFKDLTSVITDTRPAPDLEKAMTLAGTDFKVAP